MAEIAADQLTLRQCHISAFHGEGPVGRGFGKIGTLAVASMAGAALVAVGADKVIVPAHKSLVTHWMDAVRAAK